MPPLRGYILKLLSPDASCRILLVLQAQHPEVRDVCDVGQMLFWGKKRAWCAMAFMFILDNAFIPGLHILIGAKYLNTMASPATNMDPNISVRPLMMPPRGICPAVSLRQRPQGCAARVLRKQKVRE